MNYLIYYGVSCLIYFIITRHMDLYGVFALTTLVWPLMLLFFLVSYIMSIPWNHKMKKHIQNPDKYPHPGYTNNSEYMDKFK